MRLSFVLTALFLVYLTQLSAQSGTISGILVYPGEGISRDMVLWVKVTSLFGEPVYCSNNKTSLLREAKISFKLNLPAASSSSPAATARSLLRSSGMEARTT